MAYRSHYSADDSSGWTYFIEAPSIGLVKIGAAQDYWPRFLSIQSCSPVELRLVGLGAGRGLEGRLHRHFSDWRVRGEWFSLDAPGLRDLIDELPMPEREKARA